MKIEKHLLAQYAFQSRVSPKSIFAGLLLLLALSLGQYSAAAPVSGSEPEKINLQLKWKHQFQFAGYYAAIEKGFYHNAGFAVNLIEAPETGEPAFEVIEGRAEYGVTGPDILLQRAKGLPVVALAVIFQHSPLVLLARKESGINSIHDLSGKRVMIEPAAAELEAYLQVERMLPEKYSKLPHSHTPDDFISGRVDAISAYSSDELFLINQSGCEFVTLNPRSAGIDFYGDLLFTTQHQIDKSPERVNAFIKATQQGWEYALAHPEEIVDLILAKYSKRHSREHLLFEARETQRLIFANIVEIGYMNPGRWKFIADTYAGLGMIPRDFQMQGFVYETDPPVDMRYFYNIAGTFLVIIIILFNVSLSYLVKKRTKQLSIAKNSAEAANRAKSQFLANMSHELRTPLNGVIGFTELLVSSNLDQIQRQYAQNANISAHALLGIINNILDFSKIEAGRLELDNLRTDVIRLLEQTISIIRCQAEKRGIELLLNIPPEVPRFIHTDPVRLGQILINLLGNSAKFTEAGEIELHISFAANPDGTGQFCFMVRDTGIGIAPSDRENIFKEFSQVDSSATRKFGGTGLGLTISRMLVEKMGGTLDFTSEPGRGSRFFFTLNSRFEHGEPLNMKKIESIQRLLLVDDNLENLVILKRTLENWQIPSETCTSGKEALTRLQNGENFDVIIIDYMMPEMNGIETIRQIRRNIEKSGARQPVILLYSSVDNLVVHEECKNLSVQLKLVKPVRTEDLYASLCQIKQQATAVQSIPVTKAAALPDLKNTPHIMVVEDVAMNRIYVCEMIKKLLPEALIIEAQHGGEAVEKYKHSKPDLIFMDIQMPVLDGYEATRAIRRLESDSGTTRAPVIALTASAIKGEYEKCIAAGMDEFITKPIDPHHFTRIFQTYLKQ
ncbi:MAG TPA: ABC transporter substrate-binding protein [Candidatus Rifleibacterium sp.]|nr:ABC transporter substrate-binding protein [Candidatus Rifleibacterium sp.]HPT48112.1 ABC transporter substrate-binding protein [Candidatus Rifleibacterium sp.]